MEAPATAAPTGAAITDEHVEQWRREGFVVVEGVLTHEQVARACEALVDLVPTYDAVKAGAEVPPMSLFPYRSPVLDDLALNPVLIDFAERALGGPVVLSHSEMLHKYAGTGAFDQPMHQDYGNNTMIVPSLTAPDQMASITYLTDSFADMGPTAVVGYSDAGPWLDVRSWTRDEAPELYERETLVEVPAGSTVLYTQRTFHRATEITATAGVRHTLHVALMRAHVTWAGWRSVSQRGNEPWLGELLSSLSTVQRSVLGFPRPGDPYWTDETIDAVGRRYPTLDLSDYLPPRP